MTTNQRYDGKPLVRLLELYVLNIIGELSVEDADRMRAMTPKLREIYRHSGDWMEIIAASINLPPEAAVDIKRAWQTNQKIARENNVILSSQQFAEMIVDDNFSP